MPYGYGSQGPAGPAGGASSGGNYGGNKNPNQNYGGNGGNGNSSILSNVIQFITGGGFVGAAIRGIKKSAAKSKAKKEANVEIGLGTDRMSNYSTGQGGTRQEGGDSGNNTPTVIKKNIGGNTIQTTAPTKAEVSQSEAANADAAALKVKKRGRSASIMTSSQGVTKMASNYSLGKKSLLGRV